VGLAQQIGEAQRRRREREEKQYRKHPDISCEGSRRGSRAHEWPPGD
jgi:hypothetical protein